MSYQQEKFTEIAYAIREKTGTTDLIKPSEFASKVDDVFEAGKKSQYDDFWDNYQDYGNRTDYQYAFAGASWGKQIIFKPKYDIKPTRADYMFASMSNNLDMVETLEKCGVVLDTSQCTGFSSFLRYASPKRLPTIDTRSATNLGTFSANSQIEIIDKIILKDDGSQTIGAMFSAPHTNFTTVVFEGKIGKDCNFGTCTKLSHDSLMSIINALQEKSTGTFTCTLGGINLTKLTDTEKAIATQKGWTLA
jgi:hypothetical protein